ncbi:hypothetical protein CO2235_U850033 [Cupriavidus oxalaticus]|uniref:Uncharacterized protein n=1 Tax=Cupriavidus oxalaticus TaxID=96344 RepID=A0A375FW88_9BURK|nr:hypothetical protein CO2235_U850033 [Cupriavidus oxalaticus]
MTFGFRIVKNHKPISLAGEASPLARRVLQQPVKMMQQVPVEFCLSQSEQDWAELLPHAPFGSLREWSTMIQVSCKAKRTI